MTVSGYEWQNNDDMWAAENSHAFDAGDFAKADRIRVIKSGTTGKVVRVDRGSVYPIVVWLDTFSNQNAWESKPGAGMPLCACEIEKVEE